MKRNTKEDVVLKGCLTYLKLRGIFCWRNNTGAFKKGSSFVRFGYKGSSDILGILPDGRFLAVECKRSKGGVLSEEQKIFLDSICKNHGIALCVNSVEALQKEVEKLLQ